MERKSAVILEAKENEQEKQIIGIVVQILRAGYGFTQTDNENVVQLGDTLCEAIKKVNLSPEFQKGLRDRADQFLQCEIFQDSLEHEIFLIGKKLKKLLN